MKLTAKTAAQQPFLPVMRALAKTYQTFCNHDEQNLRQFSLTQPQFDVIATLGNTQGMLMNELAQRTLVTKGTLTGIVDRLEKKGLVQREVPPNNRRCFRVTLTQKGEEVFQQVFPAHITHLKTRFDALSEAELTEIVAALDKLRSIFPT
jgi:MarR family transcriptional regulator, 2-MHQ and catechol-resistance regulon repressor